MRKNRILGVIGVLGLTLLLGACRITAEPIRPVTHPEVTTNWELREEGVYVICENELTTVSFSAIVDTPRNVVEVREIYVGGETGEALDIRTPAHQLNFDASGKFTVRTTFDRFVAPLEVQADDENLQGQAIVIVPVPDPENPPARSGVTLARFQVVLETGIGVMNQVLSFPSHNDYYELPVWGGCERV